MPPPIADARGGPGAPRRPVSTSPWTPAADEAAAKRSRALRHALAEYELHGLHGRPGPAARGGPGGMTRGDRDLPPRRPEGWLTLGLVVLMLR